MAQEVVINGVTYQNVPEVDIPKVGGGIVRRHFFMEISSIYYLNVSKKNRGDFYD